MRCIFCGREAKGGRRVEHIIPESLGGGDWCVLPPGVVCDSCNQYFGSKVEGVATADYPLNVTRLMNGVITKKGKWATLPHYRGVLEARPMPGVIGLEPATYEIERAILDRRITQFRMIAETRYPALLCRMLLKIGIETIAYDNVTDALTERYDAAREFARAPRKGSQWWFLYHGDPAAGFNTAADTKPMSSGILDCGGGEVAHIEIFDFAFFVPMTSNVIPDDLQSLPEPEFRYFVVTA